MDGFFRACWTVVVPLLLVMVAACILLGLGYRNIAGFVSYGGTMLTVLGNLLYVVLWHSRSRWPGLSWSERLNEDDDVSTMSDDLEPIAFYGASDDLIEVEGNLPGCDEYPGGRGTFETCGLRIDIQYRPNGCWGIEVVRIDESVPVTAQAITLKEAGYTMRLEMDVPKGSYVSVGEVR